MSENLGPDETGFMVVVLPENTMNLVKDLCKRTGLSIPAVVSKSIYEYAVQLGNPALTPKPPPPTIKDARPRRPHR